MYIDPTYMWYDLASPAWNLPRYYDKSLIHLVVVY